jgi:hypothetical protein
MGILIIISAAYLFWRFKQIPENGLSSNNFVDEVPPGVEFRVLLPRLDSKFLLLGIFGYVFLTVFFAAIAIICGTKTVLTDKDQLGYFMFTLFFLIVTLGSGFAIRQQVRTRELSKKHCHGYILGSKDGVYIHKLMVIEFFRQIIRVDLFSLSGHFIYLPWDCITSWQARTQNGPVNSQYGARAFDRIMTTDQISLLQIENIWSRSLDDNLYRNLEFYLQDRFIKKSK